MESNAAQQFKNAVLEARSRVTTSAITVAGHVVVVLMLVVHLPLVARLTIVSLQPKLVNAVPNALTIDACRFEMNAISQRIV